MRRMIVPYIVFVLIALSANARAQQETKHYTVASTEELGNVVRVACDEKLRTEAAAADQPESSFQLATFFVTESTTHFEPTCIQESSGHELVSGNQMLLMFYITNMYFGQPEILHNIQQIPGSSWADPPKTSNFVLVEVETFEEDPSDEHRNPFSRIFHWKEAPKKKQEPPRIEYWITQKGPDADPKAATKLLGPYEFKLPPGHYRGRIGFVITLGDNGRISWDKAAGGFTKYGYFFGASTIVPSPQEEAPKDPKP